jgi:hypothetical protein
VSGAIAEKTNMIPMLVISVPILAAIVAFLYLRRATIGLEAHLKPVALAFYVVSISEFVGLNTLFRQSNNVRIYEAVAPFGWIWILMHACICIGAIILFTQTIPNTAVYDHNDHNDRHILVDDRFIYRIISKKHPRSIVTTLRNERTAAFLYVG